MPFISKIDRQSDYAQFPSTTPIVIDNGASYFRIGWAGEAEPRVVFRNIVQRPRHKVTGETVTIVGDQDPALLKYFDCTRAGPRSAFDSNVVFQFEIMEYILDFAFDRLGANGPQIDHPVLITECVCNPIQSRSKMAELLFETYGVPSVAFGVDAVFSYKYNQQLGACDKDGLALCQGFTTTHVIPFVDGEPVYRGCCRTNIGGYHVTDYLKQLLSLKYPHHLASLTWEKTEDLKMEHCYIALGYATEARLFQKGTKEAEEKTRLWQLPWVPPPVEERPTEEEIARKAAIRERQGQRLREMAEAKRSSKINELENELQGLEFLLQQIEQVEVNAIPSFLSETGYGSKLEVESALVKVTQTLRKVKGETKVEEVETEDKDTNGKYPLVDIPDNMLTPDQLKEKKRQVFLKTTTEGRQRAKQKRFEEELEREKKNKQEEAKRLENPELYLVELHTKYKLLNEKVEQRKRLKTKGGHTNGNNLSGGVGRGERVNAAHRERMRLLTTAAFDRGKGEDTFGARDEDWQLYKLMSKDNDDEDEAPEEDEAELARISSRLQDIDSTFVPNPGSGPSQPTTTEAPKLRPLTKEDYQIVFGVERFRCPEILFNPNLVGIDQVGVDDMAGVSIKRLSSKNEGLEDRLTNSILMTGGSCQFPGMCERLEAGIRMIRPCGSPIRIVRASNPVLDAWRGAAAYASNRQFSTQTFSSRDYYEKGEEWLRRYQLRYSFL